MSRMNREFETDFEVRAVEGEDGRPTIIGSAVVYGALSAPGALPYGIREVFHEGSLTKTVSEADIVALWSHETTMPLGRRSNGTLEIRESSRGVDYTIYPDTDVSWAADAYKTIRGGTVKGTSFGFQVPKGKDDWEFPEDPEQPIIRHVREARLFEISPTPIPVYDTTSAEARSEVLESLSRFASLPVEQLAEATTGPELRSILSAGVEPPPQEVGTPLLNAAMRRLAFYERIQRGAA